MIEPYITIKIASMLYFIIILMADSSGLYITDDLHWCAELAPS